MRPEDAQFNQPHRSSKKPPSVTRGVGLLYLSIILGLLLTIETSIWSSRQGATHIGGPLTVEIIIWIIFLFFTYQIGKGANWARLVMLILVIITLVMKLVSIGFVFSMSLFIGILMLVIMILQIVALCLLFNKSSRSWFE